MLFGEEVQSTPAWRWVGSYVDIADEDSATTRVLWGGVMHDALALGVFIALLYSFAGWPAWFASRPWTRRNRLLSRGLCPSCGYDTQGITAPTACPECGHVEPLQETV